MLNLKENLCVRVCVGESARERIRGLLVPAQQGMLNPRCRSIFKWYATINAPSHLHCATRLWNAKWTSNSSMALLGSKIITAVRFFAAWLFFFFYDRAFIISAGWWAQLWSINKWKREQKESWVCTFEKCSFKGIVHPQFICHPLGSADISYSKYPF